MWAPIITTTHIVTNALIARRWPKSQRSSDAFLVGGLDISSGSISPPSAERNELGRMPPPGPPRFRRITMGSTRRDERDAERRTPGSQARAGRRAIGGRHQQCGRRLRLSPDRLRGPTINRTTPAAMRTSANATKRASASRRRTSACCVPFTLTILAHYGPVP